MKLLTLSALLSLCVIFLALGCSGGGSPIAPVPEPGITNSQAKTNLSFHIYGTPVTADYVDVDIDVRIRHPFPGMTQYNGYDVKGAFMGSGSAAARRG